MSNHNARINMVKQQLRTGDVLDERILHVFETLPRNHFIPEKMAEFAYSDMQIPLPHGQRMLTPLEEGRILQALNLKGHEVVLEIGTGSGFFTAMLSKLCLKVISIEYFQDLSIQAAKKLKSHHCDNVEIIHGDGCQGWLEKAPYDVIVMTGAIEELTELLKLQIVPGGKLVAIIGRSPVMQVQLHELDHKNSWQKTLLFETDIPELENKLKPKEFIF